MKRSLFVLLGALFCADIAAAQTVFGRISGTVTDKSGGVVPNATVTVLNEATQVSRTLTTDERGTFLAGSLPVGNYTVQVENSGFKSQKRTGIVLVADGRVSVDFSLDVGDVSQAVEVVAAAGELVNTVSGEIARVVDTQQVQDLALNGRNYMQLASLIPGAVLLDENQMELTTSLSVTTQAINGNRGNTNNLTVDGGSNLDSGSNGSQINNVGIDFIREVKIQTSNFSAEYGRNSGAAINVVTRSGSNEFHGGAFEFFRNDVLDARSFFSPRRGKLRFNDFGWNIGGPIFKSKLFFFVGQEWKKIRRDTEPTRRTLPTRAERRGDFSGRTGTLNMPGTTTPIAGRNIASMITPDGRAIAAVYDRMEQLATAYTDQPIGNNTTFQMSNPFDVRQDIVRVDYTLTEAHTIYGRYIYDGYDLIEPFGTFSGSNLPTTPTNRRRPGTSYQVGHTWLLSPRIINEAKLNAAWNGQRIPPVGDTWERDTYGFTFPQLFLGGGRYENGIPNVDIGGFANWRGPHFALHSPTTDISFTNTISVMQGPHQIRGGFMVIRNRKDQNGRPEYTGFASFQTNGNRNTTGSAFADALLGNFRTYREANADQFGFFRFSQYEGFVSDMWRVNRKLNFEIGMRWQYGIPTYTVANNIVNFNPALFNFSNAVRVNANGTIVPGSGNLFNGLIRAGDGIPSDQLGRVPGGSDPAVAQVPTGAPRGLYPAEHRFAPRFSFAYAPFNDNKTAIRGGFGMFYDRPEGNLIFSQVNVAPFTRLVEFENGNIANPAGGSAAALAPWGRIDALDPNLEIPYTMSYSLSIQRELPSGIFVEGAYVANLGRHLIRQPDINQVPFETAYKNAQLPNAQRLATNAMRPYKGFSEIRMRLSDSTSNYHSAQFHVTRRKGALTATGSYTFSKVLTDSSGNGDNPENPFDRHYSYGPASFDRTHVFVTTWTYQLPRMSSRAAFLKHTVGGWEVSGIGRVQTGAPLTITGNTATGARRADYIGLPIELTSGDPGPQQWFNTAAFLAAPDDRLGNAGVGTVRGPGLGLVDLSLRKEFRPTERLRFQLRGELFNITNQVNFRNVTTRTDDRAFGQITSSGPGRNVQLGLKMSF